MASSLDNRLILNWHRIFTIDQLFWFVWKKFKYVISSDSDLKNILCRLWVENIVIWHSDTFLKNEISEKHDRIIHLLESFAVVKQTWKK